MLRRLFALGSVLSLLLCAAALLLWVRSFYVWDALVWRSLHTGGAPTAVDGLALGSQDGVITLTTGWTAPDRTPHPRELGLEYFHSPRPAAAVTRMHGFDTRKWGRTWTPGTPTTTPNGLYVFDARDTWLPDWFAAVLFAVPPVIRVLRRRKAQGDISKCAACGYDLRATPDRCPECGASAQKDS